MSTIAIARNALKSRVVRELIGERTIDLFTSLSAPEQQQEGGILGFLRGFAGRLGGFLLRVAGSVVRWALANLWDILIEAFFEIVNFDFNQADASIRQQINQNNVQIAGSLGSLVGTGLVWLAGVGTASLASLKFPVLAGKIAIALAQEGGEEIRGQVLQFLTVTRNAVTRNIILGSFLTLRRLRLFGLAPVTEAREPWTIAQAVEERVDQINNDAFRAFVENALESAGEAIIEAGYVVSYALDDYYQAMRMAATPRGAGERTVIIQPDRRIENETILLTGQQHQVQQTIQATLATHKMIHNRDVGAIVGQPAEDWLKAKIQRRKLTIVFKSRREPPYIADQQGDRVREATYTIPDVKPGLTWSEIKSAANAYTWGKYRATANLDNGRQMAVYGSTEQQAEVKLLELLQLSSANLLTLSITEEKTRHPNLRKEATPMYPAYATLLVRRSTAETTGRTDLTGDNYQEQLTRIDLWTAEEPEGLGVLT